MGDPFIKDRAGLVSSARRSGGRRAGCGWRGQGGGQSGEQDVEAAFKFGGAVVAGQDGGQAAEQGEVADRQSVQAEPEQGVSLLGADGEFLELVEDVTVQKAEQGPVDVQGIGSAESGPGEQGQDVFQGAQGAQGPQRERGGQRPGDDQRHDVGVGQRQRAVAAGDLAQLAGPVGVGGVDVELGQDGLGDAVEQGGFVRGVPVEDHRVPVQGAGQAAHGQRVGAVAVDDLQCGGQHGIAGDLAVAVAVSVAALPWAEAAGVVMAGTPSCPGERMAGHHYKVAYVGLRCRHYHI